MVQKGTPWDGEAEDSTRGYTHSRHKFKHILSQRIIYLASECVIRINNSLFVCMKIRRYDLDFLKIQQVNEIDIPQHVSDPNRNNEV